jgi:hypothetical protein
MKHPLESLMTAAGILLLAFSACCCPPLAWPGAGAKTRRHLSFDGSQSVLYFAVLSVVFTAGVIEYFVLRFIWRRWFSLAD